MPAWLALPLVVTVAATGGRPSRHRRRRRGLLLQPNGDHLVRQPPPGALHWMRQHGLAYDQHVPHLDPARCSQGGTVIGMLPVNLAAQVCARRGVLAFGAGCAGNKSRGRELSADELLALGAIAKMF